MRFRFWSVCKPFQDEVDVMNFPMPIRGPFIPRSTNFFSETG